jgi:hypothetical protein
MKKMLFIAMCAVVAMGCNLDKGDVTAIDGLSGVEIVKGDNGEYVTKYEGALIPVGDYHDGREEMIDILTLIKQQKGEIDDELFYSKLITTIASTEERFMMVQDKNGQEPAYWSWHRDWVGAQMTYSLLFNEDGTMVIRYSIPCAYHIPSDLGVEGYHNVEQWSYDADTNTLRTAEADIYRAEVLYVDDTQAVLRGNIYPMELYYDPENRNNYRRTSPMELYLLKFVDGRDRFLEGYEYTWEEIQKFLEEH